MNTIIDHWLLLTIIAAAASAPVWWVLKGLGVVTWCPIRSFATQSILTYGRLRAWLK